MLVAVDKQGNRIYADSSGVRYTECYSPSVANRWFIS